MLLRALGSFSIVALLASGCHGVVLDLGPEPAGDPTCSEVIVPADVSRIDFGKSPLADCVRFFSQVAVDLDQAGAAAEFDLGSACDALAQAGGITVSASPSVRARCQNAIAAFTRAPGSPDTPFTRMAPFTTQITAASECTPAATIPCGGCTADVTDRSEACDEQVSASARSSCSPPTVDVQPAVAPTTPETKSALAVLRRFMPTLLDVAGPHGRILRDALVASLPAISAVTRDGRLDLRGTTCAGRAEGLLLEANGHYVATFDEAALLANAIDPHHP